MNLRTTIALISSRPNPTVFGTGFVIYADATRSYLVTCAHVVRDIQKESSEPGDLQVDLVGATIEAIGTPDTIDLAVLSVPHLVKIPPLPLSSQATAGAAVQVYGQCTLEKKSAKVAASLSAILEKEVALTSPGYAVRGWRLKFQAGDRIQPGYSGGPVICADRVIAVAAIKLDNAGSEAIAIAIEAVAEIWQAMPSRLRDSLAGVSVVEGSEKTPSLLNNKSDESSLNLGGLGKAMNWSAPRKKEFRKALQACYRNYADLSIFVMDSLEENLAGITGDQGMTTVCFELIEWACARGKIEDLFAAFCDENPQYAFAQEMIAPPVQSSVTVPMNSGGSSVLKRLERQRLEKELAMVIKQYEAVSERLSTEQNPVMRPLLEQQLEELGVKIAAIEQRLKEL